MHRRMTLTLSMIIVGAGLPLDEPAAAEPGDSCNASANRSAIIDATGVTKVVIGAGAGNLTIRGEAAQTSVRAEGSACAGDDKILDQIRLESRRTGDTIFIKTSIPEGRATRLWMDSSALLDLTVVMPASVAVDIEDSSGDLELSGVRSATVEDGPGEINISNIGGDLSVSDSSGDIRIERVAGNLSVKDSSGEIKIEEVRGNVDVPIDSSGGIQIERVGGKVHIGNDSSGDIAVSQVQGDAVIDSDSSGDIKVEQIGGSFTVGADASGEVNYNRISGKVRIPAKTE